jgi:uncharacterized protein (TIGR02271 family)
MATRAARKAHGGSDSFRAVDTAVVPVIQEQATVYKRTVETGKVRISKHVREYEELVDVPHFQEEVIVDRVPVKAYVDESPAVRTEGDVTIIPILEERYVLEKKLFLVEELHVRKEKRESHQPQKVKVLKEEVEVRRLAPGETADNVVRGSKPANTKSRR